MSFRHKRIQVFEKGVSIDSSIKRGPSIISTKLELQNAGKINHKLNGDFQVIQTNKKNDLTIKFFILTDIQFIKWVELTTRAPTPAFTNMAKSNLMDPPSSLYSTKGSENKGSFELIVGDENSMYFILDNSFSSFKSKNVKLTIWEEWDEKIEALDVVTTIPPDDNSLHDDVNRLISLSNKKIKIITPHMDMTFVKDLLEKHRNGVIVEIITQGKDGVKAKSNLLAFETIQKELGKNHRTNDLIHSRLIIADDLEAIISSADLNHSSMLSQYNAGILLADPTVIQKLVNFFNQVWKDSEPQE